MDSNEIKLEPRLVGDIEGNLYIESYQRGYRWSAFEIKRLLEDIYDNFNVSLKNQKIPCKNGIIREFIREYCYANYSNQI